jgi:predicted cation transporter
LFIGGNNDGALPVPRFFFNDMPLSNAFYISSRLAVIQQTGPSNGLLFPVNITGQQYSVDTNSILMGGGVAFPGTVPGIVYSGGQVVP